jgi:hypothetical protein
MKWSLGKLCHDLQYFELPYFLRDIVAGVESFGCTT